MGRVHATSIKARTSLALVVCTFAGLLTATSASAATLDQEQTHRDFYTRVGQDCAIGGGGDICANDFAKAQTFTAGLTGNLDRVDLEIYRDAEATEPLTVQIRSVEADCPSSEVLATTALAATEIPIGRAASAWIPIQFSSPANVIAGTRYAIVVHTPTLDFSYWLGAAFTDVYAGGQMCVNGLFSSSGEWFPRPEVDLAFRTFVEQPQPPPTAPTAVCQQETVNKIDGTPANDTLLGTPASDAIFGLAGNDDLDGVRGNDCLDGGEGDDTLRGGAGDDLQLGGDGNDKVRGQGGKDDLDGAEGDDRVNGGEGKDRMTGGPGADKMRGAAAKDRYEGNAGDDKLNAVDAKTDRVNCGGGDDKATVDPIDRVSPNCEDVHLVEND